MCEMPLRKIGLRPFKKFFENFIKNGIRKNCFVAVDNGFVVGFLANKKAAIPNFCSDWLLLIICLS